MPTIDHLAQAADREHAMPSDAGATLFAALELSLTSWVVVASAPGQDGASKHTVAACDGPGLLALLNRLRSRAEARCGHLVSVAVMQEAGRDGFWIHRLLEGHGIVSHVVDPASIAVSRRSRRAKTDRIDAEMMLRTLLAWARGERGVCSMVRPPMPAEEDTRRLHREREALLAERIRHANRIKGLLATQGVFNFEPTGRKRRVRLGELRLPGGAELPARLRAELGRQLDRLELTLQQLATVEAERDAMLAAGRAKDPAPAIAVSACGDTASEVRPMMPNQESAGARLLRLKGVGPETASVLAGEAFFRDFRNRREVASYAGLTPSPWQSGGIDRDQGISKGGNGRLRRSDGATRLVVVAQPARQRPEQLVSHSGRRRPQPGQAHRHCCPCPQAACGALALCRPRLGAHRRCAEVGVGQKHQQSCHRSLAKYGRAADPRWTVTDWNLG